MAGGTAFLEQRCPLDGVALHGQRGTVALDQLLAIDIGGGGEELLGALTHRIDLVVEQVLAAKGLDLRRRDGLLLQGVEGRIDPFQPRQERVEHLVAQGRAVALPARGQNDGEIARAERGEGRNGG